MRINIGLKTMKPIAAIFSVLFLAVSCFGQNKYFGSFTGDGGGLTNVNAVIASNTPTSGPIVGTNSGWQVVKTGTNLFTEQLHVSGADASGWNIWAQEHGFNVKANGATGGVYLDAGANNFVVNAAGITLPTGNHFIFAGSGLASIQSDGDLDFNGVTNRPIVLESAQADDYFQYWAGTLNVLDMWGNTMVWTNGNLRISGNFVGSGSGLTNVISAKLMITTNNDSVANNATFYFTNSSGAVYRFRGEIVTP